MDGLYVIDIGLCYNSIQFVIFDVLTFFQPVLHNRCHKDHGVCYPVCGMVYIKEPLLLIGKNNPCGGSSRFPLSLPLPYIPCQITINKMC